jgi:glycosyltransferase involved in cell wall biosynthesis
MPAYNAEKYIDEAVQSVIHQSYTNIELIIINDGSTDSTEKVLEKYKGTENITIIHTQNRGQCAAANLAFRNSKGDFIKFFDADDIMNETHVAAQVQRLLTNPNCIAAGQVKRFYNNDINTALHEPRDTWQDLNPMDWLVIGNGGGIGMMGGWLFLIPRPLLLKAGLWNEGLSLINDYEFSPRVILQAEKVLFTEDAKIYYRSGLLASLSNSFSPRSLQSAFTALEMTESLLLSHEDSDRVRAALSQFWHLWAYNFFLDDMELYRKTESHLKALGNYPNVYFREAPGKVLRLIGWKNHKRIKRLLHQLKLK